MGRPTGVTRIILPLDSLPVGRPTEAGSPLGFMYNTMRTLVGRPTEGTIKIQNGVEGWPGNGDYAFAVCVTPLNGYWQVPSC